MFKIPYAVSIIAFASANIAAVDTALAAAKATGVAILTQAEGLPEDFRHHFFDTPLTTRIEVNQQFLGEATILLSQDETIQFIAFTDTTESKLKPEEQQRWSEILRENRRLGSCDSNCPSGLQVLHYSLENSVLSIITNAAERSGDNATSRFHALPEDGSGGLMLRNNLNLNGGAEQGWAGRYALDALGSIGHWNIVGSAQLDQSASNDSKLRHSMQRLYAQREIDGQFIRAGYFTPDAQGVVRQPRTPGGLAYTTLGMMFGSSDRLLVDSAAASVYPIYVTANRDATVEIYRNGSLINSQPVQTGLQVIDTRQLPSGIYEVEVRMVEDGVVTSRSEELIYKPNNWRNPEQRWRYSVFAGQQRSLLDSEVNSQAGDMTAGVVANYLLHPRAVLGMSLQSIGSQTLFGASVDVELAERARLFANAYQSGGYGTGMDTQALFPYRDGSVVLSHNRSWLDNLDSAKQSQGTNKPITPYQGINQSSSISVNHKLNEKTNVSARLANNKGYSNGNSLDLSVYHRRKLFGSDGTWRVSAFDRAASNGLDNGQRNRGVDLTLTMALGKEGSRVSGSAGSRSGADGKRDQYATLSYYKEREHQAVRSLSASATADRYGLALSSSAELAHRLVRGDAYLQRSSFNGQLSGGLNLESTVAIGGGKIATSGDYQAAGGDAGLIIDVESDMPEMALQGHDTGGRSIQLQVGRNVVPVTAYKSGVVQFDFTNDHGPAASIHPSSTVYHLSKGGVDYRQIRVMKTVTVMGRLLNEQGEPLKGVHVVNHAGHSVTEADGFFAVEMSERAPILDIRHSDAVSCQIALDTKQHKREADMLLIGDVSCATKFVQTSTAGSEI